MVSENIRRAERVKSLLRAEIIFNNRVSTVECVIKNISPLGAKLMIGETTAVPSEFELHVPRRGRSYRSRIVWRDPEAIGVEFLEEAADVMPEAGHGADIRVQELERQVAELKARVRALSKRLADLGQDPDLVA